MQERPVDIVDAAELLGTTVRHLRTLVTRREVPFYRLGRKLRFRPSELEAYLASRRVEPHSAA